MFLAWFFLQKNLFSKIICAMSLFLFICTIFKQYVTFFTLWLKITMTVYNFKFVRASFFSNQADFQCLIANVRYLHVSNMGFYLDIFTSFQRLNQTFFDWVKFTGQGKISKKNGKLKNWPYLGCYFTYRFHTWYQGTTQ